MPLTGAPLQSTVGNMSHEDILKRLTPFEALFLTIYGEGRGEPIEGQVAIGHVINNRLRASKLANPTYKDICLSENQFSCWNSNDGNFPLLIEIAQVLLMGESVLGDIALKQCICVARGIQEGQIMDNTHNSQNYMTTKLFLSSKKPTWAAHPKQVKTIGNHSFLIV